MANAFLNTTADKVLRTLQLVQLECVKELDRICRKHNIEYMLGGGTCLGRYRHGGFIPWDDDIDIDMTAENYDKFIKIAPKEIDSERFKLVCRTTSKNHYRTAARLEALGTHIGSARWEKMNLSVGVHVEIFRITYMPDDIVERNKVRDKLIFLRCMEYYKMTHNVPKMMSNSEAARIRLMSKFISAQRVEEKEEAIIIEKCLKPTTWKMSDSLVACNFEGYPADGSESVQDVTFEGINLMDRENPVPFLTALYGADFDKWLEPGRRISHHKWTDIDFGEYAKLLDLPENYSDYITIKYNKEKLTQMQKVTLYITKTFDEICTKNHLKYWVLGCNAALAEKGNDKISSLWREPLTVGMPRKDYEEFINLKDEKLLKRFYIQSHKTEKDYYYEHARLRLNFTELSEVRLNAKVKEKIHNGFFINIIPLDEAGDNQEKTNKKIDLLNRMLFTKWNALSLSKFLNMKFKTKMLAIIGLFYSKEGLWEAIEKELIKNNNTENCKRYRMSVQNDRKSCCISKDILGDGQRIVYLGTELTFPSDLTNYANAENRIDEKQDLDSIISNIKKSYPRCSLTFYDSEDYQFSAIRYDNDKKKLLSNAEILDR